MYGDDDTSEDIEFSLVSIKAALASRSLSDDERAYLKDNLDHAKLLKEREEARRKKIDNDLKEREMIPMDEAKKVFDVIKVTLRGFGDALRREFGNDAVDLWNDHLSIAQEAVKKGFSGRSRVRSSRSLQDRAAFV